MAEKNQDNDEYEFIDLDNMNNNPGGFEEYEDESEKVAPVTERKAPPKNVRRNALITIAIIFLLLLTYEFVSSFFSKQPSAPQVTKEPIITKQEPIAPKIQPIQPITPTPITPATPVASTPSPELKQSIEVLKLNQQTIKSDIDAVNEKLTSFNGNITDIGNKLTTLANNLTNISQKVEEQSQQIASLIQKTKEHKLKIKKLSKNRHHGEKVVYYLQAVIPGRAWLIASNGSTLTVREGTHIPGYGVVKLIDAEQGRILLRSGRIIRFSEQDS